MGALKEKGLERKAHALRSQKTFDLPDPPDGSVVPAVATEEDVRKAIMSFRAGASGGPDGLHPGHLRSLVANGSAEAVSPLLSALTDLANVMLRGEVPQFAVPILYGANECAIRKTDGGIRPIIAVGSTVSGTKGQLELNTSFVD